MTRNSNGSWSKDLQKIIQRQMAELSNDTNNTIELKKAELESAISGITCDIHGKEAEVVSVKEGTWTKYFPRCCCADMAKKIENQLSNSDSESC